jgi:hypothetical protein
VKKGARKFPPFFNAKLLIKLAFNHRVSYMVNFN